MAWWIGGLLIPACVIGGWIVIRRPLRQILDDLNHEEARLTFRRQRERLEARFVTSLTTPTRSRACGGRKPAGTTRSTGPGTAAPGISSPWSASISTRPPYLEEEDPRECATALFEYRKGAWRADGICLQAMLPHEACLRSTRFVPVVPPPPQI